MPSAAFGFSQSVGYHWLKPFCAAVSEELICLFLGLPSSVSYI